MGFCKKSLKKKRKNKQKTKTNYTILFCFLQYRPLFDQKNKLSTNVTLLKTIIKNLGRIVKQNLMK